MKKLIGLCVGMGVSSLAFAAGGVFLGQAADRLHMEQIPAPTAEERLIGGEAVGPDEVPGVFYTRQDNSRCTGTVVASRVVASAAHCMSNGGKLSLTYKDKTYEGRCTHAPGYRGNSTADWALCLLSEPLPDAIAESVNTDGSRLKEGDEIVLMGYGCTRRGGSGGNDGTLRKGQAPIVSLPSGRDYDIVTRGDSALCFGDSGGPSFYVDGETGERFQLGINSRGDISTTSYLSSLHVDAAQEFYKEWAEEKGVGICGIHADAEGCRQSGEPAPELPEECKAVAANGSIAKLNECSTARVMPDPAACQTAIDAVQACVDARK